jgi:hypothetical protein
MRFQSHERTENRKLEREALQFKSKQALTNASAAGNPSFLQYRNDCFK